MAFVTPSPFAQLAASPLAAAFPGATTMCPAAAQNDSRTCDDVDAFGNISTSFGSAHQVPKRALTAVSVPLRAGSYCLAGSLSACKVRALGRISYDASAAGGPSTGLSTLQDSCQRSVLPQHMSLPPCRDLDALLAAAACKPDYRASTDLGTPAPAGNAAGEIPMPAAPAHAAAVCAVMEQYGVRHVADGSAGGIADAALGLMAEHSLADTFYLYDLGEVARLYDTWVSTMPRVAPYYAVKCNPEPSMVAMLAALGAGFDCASIQELQLAAAHGVTQDRIIFANPCKRPADFRYAAEHGVGITTFDCASELEKIARGYPSFKCVLRIRCDDASAKINLGLKYGADLCDAPMLLGMAKDLGLQVVGVSFHVGSGCQNVGVYADAISAARQAFDIGAAYGFNMELLDIGGGFTAPYDEPNARLFYTTAAIINTALETHFPVGCGVRVIAEPGRYFAETSATLFTTILGQREGLDALGGPFRDYWLSDGTYGSFRIQVAVDGLEPTYSVLRSPLLPNLVDETCADGDPVLLPCRLWGNSDRDGDVVHKAAMLPALRDGDWLMFPFAGAYTICAASNYGGVRFTQPQKLFLFSGSVERDTCGFDLAAGEAAAGAAWHVNKPADGSCCDSDAGPTLTVFSDSGDDNSGDGAVDGGSSGSPHSTAMEGGVACLLCGVRGAAGMDAQHECAGSLCGEAASMDDGCMSVASDGTAAAGMVVERCGDSQAENEIDFTSMVIA